MKGTLLSLQSVQVLPYVVLTYCSVHEQVAICVGLTGTGYWFLTCPLGSHWLKKSPISWPSKTCSAV